MKLVQPLSSKVVIRILVVLVVLLALAAGYYKTKSEYELKRYNRLVRQTTQGDTK